MRKPTWFSSDRSTTYYPDQTTDGYPSQKIAGSSVFLDSRAVADDSVRRGPLG
jgi:hypothetical protein